MTTLCLSGKKQLNQINLTGKISLLSSSYSEPIEVIQIKIQIMNKLIIPLMTNKWEYLKENAFFTDILISKINKYYEKYNLEDLVMYREFVRAYDIMINEHVQLENIEKKMYEDLGNAFIYKTSMIKLKPEYELYNLIFGRPMRNKGEKYDRDILSRLEDLVKIDNMDFNKIKNIITK
jgi:hypothetical protein